MATDEGDDDIPVLSAYALAALQEFYDEQITKQECVNTVQEDWVKLLLAHTKVVMYSHVYGCQGCQMGLVKSS